MFLRIAGVVKPTVRLARRFASPLRPAAIAITAHLGTGWPVVCSGCINASRDADGGQSQEVAESATQEGNVKGPYSRRLAGIVAAAVLTAGMVAVNASPAHAAWGTCVSSYGGQPVVGCLYFHENGGGATFPVTTSQGCKNLPSYWNDVVSSLLNRTTSGYKLVIWRD